MLEVKDVKFSYVNSAKTTFKFDLEAALGNIVVVEGKSGVGKSTLLSLISGFLTPNSGLISWFGDNLTNLAPADRPLSMMFQHGNLFDHLNCQINIGLGLKPSLSLSKEEWCAVDQIMDELGILELKHCIPENISGGQQQRVALARAVLRAKWQNRKLLLLDEPFSALDHNNRISCIDVVKSLIKSKNMAALLVSHNPDDARRLDAQVYELPTGIK